VPPFRFDRGRRKGGGGFFEFSAKAGGGRTIVVEHKGRLPYRLSKVLGPSVKNPNQKGPARRI